MQIDNYDQAIALTEKMKEHLPIKAYATKELVKGLKAQGKAIAVNRAFTINLVSYSGDMGGIMCTLDADSDDKEVFVTSITHLKIDPDHPLAEEIQTYQRQRTRKLAIQDSRGFAAEMMKNRLNSTSKNHKRKGFGK